jgi:hypothetical protein
MPVLGLDGGPLDAKLGGIKVGARGPSESDGIPGVEDLEGGPIGGGIEEERCGLLVGGRDDGALSPECGSEEGIPIAWFAAATFPLTLRLGGPLLGGGGVEIRFDASPAPPFLLTHFLSSGS